jgi:HNH endonuclease
MPPTGPNESRSSPFDSLPTVTGGTLKFEPYPGATGIVGHVFRSTDTTYKFYWFLSLLEKAKHSDPRQDITVFVSDLGREMIAQAWHTRRFFKLWFGHQDRLQTVIDDLADSSNLPPNSSLQEIRSAARTISEDNLGKLLAYVPFRFLTPWLRSALIGIEKDAEKNLAIRLLAERSHRTPRPAPYRFDKVLGKVDAIHLTNRWLVFFHSNYIPLRAFAQLSLAKYFEVRNPGIPAIINKLELVQERDLRLARKFWDFLRTGTDLCSIYSEVPIEQRYDIDHFLPWSFVTHDLIWNLTPIPKAENVRKSDAVPSLSRYLANLVSQHANAVQIVAKKLHSGNTELDRLLSSVMKEYSDLFHLSSREIFLLSRDDFAHRLGTEFRLQADLARRLNFEMDWELH